MTDNYKDMAAEPLHLQSMIKSQSDSNMQTQMLMKLSHLKARLSQLFPLGSKLLNLRLLCLIQTLRLLPEELKAGISHERQLTSDNAGTA